MWLRRLCPALVLMSLLAPARGAVAPRAASIPRSFGTGLNGHPNRSLFPAHAQLAVLLFIASDCPISNRYLPEIDRLEQEFAPRGVAFWMVYPNLTETASGIQAHQAAFAHHAPLLTDPRQQLSSLTGAKVTPEAAVLVPSGKQNLPHAVYVGRIDDRYLSIGKERPHATRHDLEDAISDALSGKPVPPPGGPAVGCGIVSAR